MEIEEPMQKKRDPGNAVEEALKEFHTYGTSTGERSTRPGVAQRAAFRSAAAARAPRTTTPVGRPTLQSEERYGRWWR